MSIGRITNQMLTSQILGEINQSESQMDNTEVQLSSGLSINQPSDNPYGASLAIQLNGQLDNINEYQSNITDANGWSGTASTALNTIYQLTQSAQEIVTEAGNGSSSPQNLAQMGTEIQGIITQIKSAANSQYNGQYIFSGTETGTQPYPTAGSYAGNHALMTRTIGPAATATVNVDVSGTLGDGTDDGTGLLGTLQTIADQLTGDTNTSALNGSDLTDLSSNLDQLQVLQTQVGATQNQLTMASSTLSDLQTSVTSQLSDDQDANMATTETTFSNEQAAFTAALKAGASIVQTSLMDFLSDD